MMKVYFKIVMLFLAFTCTFALAKHVKDRRKKEANPASENHKMNKAILQKKRKILKQNQVMKNNKTIS